MKPLDFWRGGATPQPQGGANLPAVQLNLPVEAAVVSTAPRLFRTAAWVIGLGLGLFVLWAAIAPLNRGATAPGRLDMATSRTTVQHLDGGTIAEVLVREGDTVKAGQVLARMDSEQVRIQLEQFKQQRLQRLIEQSVLRAELTGSSPVFPPDVLAAQDAETQAYRSIQLSSLQNRRAARAAEKAVLREQISRLDLQAQGLQGQVESYQGQIELINDEVQGLQSLYERGFASKQRLLALRREGQRLAGERGSTISAISQSRVQQGEARQRIIQVDSRALDEAAQRLATVEQELALLDDKISSQQLAMNRTDVKAPTSGIILDRVSGMPGAVIRPGDPILQIVPSGPMLVKAQLMPRDVESVGIGSKARIRLSGLNMQKTPQLDGRVTYVSADTLGDPKTQLPYYEVRVEVPPEEQAKLAGTPLTAGMPVDVMIDAGARTALAYLTEPLFAIFDRSFRE